MVACRDVCVSLVGIKRHILPAAAMAQLSVAVLAAQPGHPRFIG